MAALPGVARIRYTTSHPRDMDDALIAAHGDGPRTDAVPASAGAVRVRPDAEGDEPRPHRRRIPAHHRPAARGSPRHGAVVGFHRRASRRDRSRISATPWRWWSGCASPRRSASNTPNAPARQPPAPPPRSPKTLKDRRLWELQALLREQQAKFNSGCVGLTIPVLFSHAGRHPGQIVGRSPWLQGVHCIGPAELIGTEQPVRIAEAHTNSLAGVLLSATPEEERACA